MSKETEFTDQNLTNIARGFDAPAKPDLLEKLQAQARERELEMTQEPERSPDSSLDELYRHCLLYTSPSPRDGATTRMPSSA